VSRQIVRRPLWKAFQETSLPRAAAFARAGGHAVVWAADQPPSAWLLMPSTKDRLSELSRWALVLLGRSTFGRVRRAPARGLALIRVPRRFESRVAAWCHRDSQWRGATRAIALECTTCGACCHHCHPAVLGSDLARWRKAGRLDLANRRNTSQYHGHRVIRLRPVDQACLHLDGQQCSIYAIRPYACRVFPPGCESCLMARREVFGIVDGLPAES
jgi:uncharacterized protein